MPWEGRISGWDIFVASFERFDRNLECTKSSAVTALIASPFAAGLGFLMKSSPGTAVIGGFFGGSLVFVGSGVFCMYKKILKELQESTDM